MMNKITILLTAVLFTAISTMAQVAINKDGSDADASAILDVKATDGGFLPPRLTKAQRDAISSLADGLVIFNTTSKCLEFCFRGFWYKNCPFVPTVTNITTGEIWMDRNLGDSQVAASSTDVAAFGDLYQWGRATEGHADRSSSTTSTIATTPTPNQGNTWDGKFIMAGPGSNWDWLTPQNNNLWQGESGTNNPCPDGFRIPTQAEWEAERQSWASNDAAGAFGSPLKLTVGGYRDYSDGLIKSDGSSGYYWSCGTASINSFCLGFTGSSANSTFTDARAQGFSIRCIKD